MGTVVSKDGTQIAFEKSGTGAPVILVDGAFCYRQFGPMPGLTGLLSAHFTVFMYDRRGRGESGDSAPYAPEREIDDIAALIEEAGGSAFVYGTSSGAILALKAAGQLPGIRKLAMYEPPFNDDALERAADYTTRLTGLLAAGQRGEAVEAFMTYVGTPQEAFDGMRQSPMWPLLEGSAPTLAYDNTLLDGGAVPTELAARINIPTLIMTGGATLPFMHVTADRLQEAIPNAQRRILEGQTHDAAAEAVAPALIEFFNS